MSTIAVPNLLVVNEKMDPALAESLAKLLFDHKADLEKVHPSAKEITRDNAPQDRPGAPARRREEILRLTVAANRSRS